METFFSNFKKQEIKNKIREVFYRFPISALMSIIVTVMFFTFIAGSFPSEIGKLFGRIIMSSIVVFFLSASITLLGESLKKKKYIPVGYIGSLVFGGLFFYFLSADIDSFENIVFFILTLFGVISFLFFAPYTKYLKNNTHKEESYYVYFYKISVIFFISCIVGGSLALLGNIAIWSVQVLFDIGYSFSDDIHGYWTSFALGFLTPIFALYQIPAQDTFEESYFNENAFFNFLIRYIALPFIYIYFFILYAYILKVLLNFSDWPKGEVSWMVIGFSLFGYITYIFSYIFECGKKQESYKFITLFRKYFPYIVLPPVAMLFYAIFLRIGQYDLTINRYFVVAFGIWLTATSLYLIISQKKSLIYIPALLTLFTLVISIGPWSVYHLPLSRQTDRLEQNLIEANILQNDTIIALKNYEDISPELSEEIYEGIKYICGFDNCNKVKELFPKVYADILKEDEEEFHKNKGNYNWGANREYTGPSSWTIISELTKKLNVRAYYTGNNNNESSNLYIYSNHSLYPLDVREYDYIMQINSSDNDITNAYIDMKKQTLTISMQDLSEEINISSIIQSLRTSYKNNTIGDISPEKTAFKIEGALYSGTFFIENASIPREENTQLKEYERSYITYISGTLLLKIK